MDFQLRNKTVFVSGSYRGTGHTIAERFVSEGARVIVHAHERINWQPRPISLRWVSRRRPWHPGWDGSRRRSNRQGVRTLDVLVNNYGIAMGGNLEQLSYEDWHAMYDHNLVSCSAINAAPPFIETIESGANHSPWHHWLHSAQCKDAPLLCSQRRPCELHRQPSQDTERNRYHLQSSVPGFDQNA